MVIHMIIFSLLAYNFVISSLENARAINYFTTIFFFFFGKIYSYT